MTRAISFAVPLLALLTLRPADVAASGGQPVYVVSTVASAVRVRVAEGTVFPCDASDNRVILDRWLAPNTYVVIGSDAPDLCFDHTGESFPEGDWQPAEHVRRDTICRRGSCRASPGPALEFYVR